MNDNSYKDHSSRAVLVVRSRVFLTSLLPSENNYSYIVVCRKKNIWVYNRIKCCPSYHVKKNCRRQLPSSEYRNQTTNCKWQKGNKNDVTKAIAMIAIFYSFPIRSCLGSFSVFECLITLFILLPTEKCSSISISFC